MSEIFQFVYYIVAEAEILLALILIGRYVYLEPVIENKKIRMGYVLLCLSAGALIQIAAGGSEYAAVLSVSVCFCLYVVLTRKSHRLRGCFLVFPVYGMLVAPLALIDCVPYALTGVDLTGNQVLSFGTDGLFWLGVILFYFFGKNFRERFAMEISHRKMGRWERNFLHGAGLFLLTTGILMLAVSELELPEGAARMFVGLGSFSAALLEVSLIALVYQGNKKVYYQYLTALNEHYLKAEVEHFRTYQENIQDIRRFRHDIRNHFLCLKELADRGRTEKIREYVSELSQELSQTDTLLHCGNEIVDAVINEKHAVAQKRGVKLQVDGILPGNLSIRPTDLCILFANALDNALEAQTDQIAGKWIRVKIRHQNDMLNLTFENPTVEEAVKDKKRFTTKRDKKNHGFGMENMRAAAERYHGKVEFFVEEEEGVPVYHLNILLFTTKRAPLTT